MNNNEFFKLIPIVQAYFEGERREMLLIILASALAVLITAALFFITRDGFAKSLLLTVLASALLLSGIATGLLWRDPKVNNTLTLALQSEQAPFAVRVERARVKKIVDNYRSYRFMAAAIGVVSLLILALTRQSWMHGVSAGLLTLVLAQIVIDHYSEQRATGYLASLSMTSGR